MYYVYILFNKNSGMLYIGYTENLRRRLKEHKYNKVNTTRNKGLWKLIFYEAYISKKDARRREKYLKTAKGRTTLKTMLRDAFL